MAFIELLTEGEATGPAADLLEQDRAQRGYVPNYARALGRRPAAYAGWRQLIVSIRAEMDPRRYELVTLAVARTLRSSYCSLEHGRILAAEFLGPATVRAAVADPVAAGLDDVDVAVMELARKVADDATSVEAEDLERLRGLGLSELETMDVVLAAAARCFFSKAFDALGVQPHAVYRELEPELREALTVGRPIAGEHTPTAEE